MGMYTSTVAVTCVRAASIIASYPPLLGGVYNKVNEHLL